MSFSYSNLTDCRRYGCPATPWNWASRWVLEQACLDGGQVVLDVGAGDNPVLMNAWKLGAKAVYPLDLTPPDRRGWPGHIKSIVGSGDAIPLRDGSVDRVVSVSVFEHLPVEMRRVAMREVRRVLRPGGRFVFTIGVLMGADRDARERLRSMPYFTDRRCPVYFPIDIPGMLAGAGGWIPDFSTDVNAGADTVKGRDAGHGALLERLPGGGRFDEARLLRDDDLCTEDYRNFEPLNSIPSLARVRVAELGVSLVRSRVGGGDSIAGSGVSAAGLAMG